MRHRGAAGSVGDVADRPDLGLGPPEDLQRRQAGDDVEEVAGQRLERAELAVAWWLRVARPISTMKIGMSGTVTAMIDGREPVLARRRRTSTVTGTMTASTSWGR